MAGVGAPSVNADSVHVEVREANDSGSQARGKPEGKELWGRTSRTMKRVVRVSMSFRTLRDMCGTAYISPAQLKPIKLLGDGAFAVVEQCMFTSVDKIECPVAVKRLKPEVFQTKREVECFLEEADLLRRLRHLCIVEFLGVGITDKKSIRESDRENVYLVQEYMDGGTLKSLVTKQMRDPSDIIYSDAQALEWLIQIAKGIRYLHEAKPKVIHRDIKLENVLLKKGAGGKLSAKLADFGLHTLIHAKRASRKFTQQELAVQASTMPRSAPVSRGCY